MTSMKITQASTSSMASAEVLILNDSFVRMIEFKAKNGNKFPPSYDALVAFLTKVAIISLIHSTGCSICVI